MKKYLLLFSLIVFLFACKGQSQNQNQATEDIGLERLTCDEQSILEKMDDRLFYNFGNVEKFSVDLMVKPKNENAVFITVETVGFSVAKGNVPSFKAYLANGVNTIKIISTSKKDASNKKEYVIRINKKPSSTPKDESSGLKELKMDDKDVLLRMGSNTICEVPDVAENKNETVMFVLPHNSSANVVVSNGGGNVENTSTNTYKVSLDYGLNEIHVAVSSSKEGEKLYVIKVYRTENLNLESFNVDGKEYCNNAGEITEKYLRFPQEKASLKVGVKAKTSTANVIFKQNGNEIKANDGFYNLNLVSGNNGIEITVEGREGVRRKTYNVLFIRLSEKSINGGLIKLEADKTDLLPLLTKENSVILPSRDNDKAELKLEVVATSEYSIKVLFNDVEIQGANGLYDISLKEGQNKIVVNLIKGSETKASYSIFIKRYPQQASPQTPQADEVKVSFVVSDGVNGSSVDGSYLNISKSKNPTTETNKRVLIKNGKAEANLKKNEYYDFKIEGQNDEYSPISYAASDIISYYLGNVETIVPMVQRPLQRITKKANAPIITELKFGSETLSSGEEKSAGVMQNISVKMKTQAPIRKLDWASPFPMLGVGFVPTTADGTRETDVFYAKVIQDNTRNSDGTYESSWQWDCSSVSLLKEEYIDVVLVVYDIASNRIERHIRLKNTNALTEDSTILVNKMALDFTRYPTSSTLYSVGQDAGTCGSSHYTSELSFDVKIGTSSISCKGFDLYRKCVEDGGDFVLVKHVVNKVAAVATESKPHKIYDNDGLLEDGKTYQYKVVAYTEDGKKSTQANSEEISVKVPKSTTLLLEYPVNQSITLNDAKNLGFVFRFSTPEVLKNAKEMELGLMIADRAGNYLYGSKFKYIFDEGGKPELYFAKRDDSIMYDSYYLGTYYSQKRSKITDKALEDLIIVDMEKGTVKITKDFISLIEPNIAAGKTVNYRKGVVYYWDVLDWGLKGVTDYCHAAKIIMKTTNDKVKVTVPVNDNKNGENAWNGRAEFGVKFD